MQQTITRRITIPEKEVAEIVAHALRDRGVQIPTHALATIQPTMDGKRGQELAIWWSEKE
jgi:hypothetical protein